jgi:hypothetical protein
MASGEFQVVFQGELTADRPEAEVKQQLATLFKMPAERVEALFTGKPVVVKNNIDAATAQKLAQTFRQAGAVCRVRGPGEHPPATPASSAATESSAPPTDPAMTVSAASAGAAPARVAGTAATAGDPNETIRHLDVPDTFGELAVDTADAPLEPPKAPAAPAIDTSGLDLAGPDAGPLTEAQAPPPAAIDTSDLSLESLESDSPTRGGD